MVNESYNQAHVDLHSLAHALIVKKWFVLGITLVVFIFTIVFLMMKPLEYQTHAILLIQQKNSENTNQTSNKPPLFNLTTIPAEPISAHIALMHSSLILDPVIQSLNLATDVRPYKKFYLNPFRLKSDDKIDINVFKVSNQYLNKSFFLKIDDSKHYRLYSPKEELIVKGEVGRLFQNKGVTIQINKIEAIANKQFVISKHPDRVILEKLRKQLTMIHLNENSDTNADGPEIIQISLAGKDPVLITNILNQIVLVAQKKNVERKIEQAQQLIDFLNKQLIISKKSLQQSEEKFYKYRETNGQIDSKLQTQYLMNHISEIDKQIETMLIKKINLLQEYTEDHPEIILLNKKVNALKNYRNSIFSQLKKVPASDQVAINLSRQVTIQNNFYTNLLNQINTLEIIKSGMLSDISRLSAAKIPDAALPIQSIFIAVFSIFLGLVLGCFLVMIWTLIGRLKNLPLPGRSEALSYGNPSNRHDMQKMPSSS